MSGVQVHPDVAMVMRVLGDLGLACSPAKVEADNAEYGAAISAIGRSPVRFRVGKLTPTKVGLFVTVWRRSLGGSTEPLPAEEDPDMLVVCVGEDSRVGAFAFPKAALVKHGVVSVGGAGGKRGFRVYPPWSATTNRQAKKSQQWQCNYFFEMADGSAIDAQRAIRLLVEA
ncbi:MepB family protein [Pseudarthrobacter cellobiosi]|uniref:MepB family protein n=1 Tax=Pseudarthrobacter cellobiosi TaxID=2953654 RepID=UPI00208FCFDD|nr:MepB family protein [Pseudarthrobacter sp. HLT1-5]MCO4254785.1 MepB family protein [Pseudarthrobacter sp. HLT1-5]